MATLNELRQKAESESQNVIMRGDGSYTEVEASSRSGCVVCYTDCTTQQFECQPLQPGETFVYGDWDGSQCVRKDYTCNPNDSLRGYVLPDNLKRNEEALASTKRISISFRANGEGTMECSGLGSFPCLGKPGLGYTRDLTVRGIVEEDKFDRKFSQEFQVWMSWAILIMGQRGIYIHEGPDTLSDNGGATAGCIHLGMGNAERVYRWVDGRTRITIEYPWTFRL